MPHNLLVTGANGQLGNEMQRIVAANPGKVNAYFTDVDTLDISDAAAVRAFIEHNAIDVIVNCAAYTAVDRAEDDMVLCAKLNIDAVANLASAARDFGAKVLHISTDYVFGGDPYNTPCREDQKGTPTGVYGLTKLHGEQKIEATGCDHVIIRTAWLYSEFGHNFVKTMLNLTATKPMLKVVFDQTGTPTYAGDLANVIFDIVENRKFEGNTGVYHFSNEGVCSWYDFTKMIALLAGHTDCDIEPCHSDEYPSPVTRPAYSVLDKTKIKETFGVKIPYWLDSLKKCMNNINNE